MFCRRMVQFLGVGVLGFAILGLSVSTTVAQETRQPKSKGPSLVDRLSGLRKKFLKKEEKKTRSDSTSHRRNIPEMGPRKTRTKNPSVSKTAFKSKSKPAKHSGLPRIQVGDLLPKNLFEKSNPTEPVVTKTVPRSSSSRAGSAVGESKQVRIASRPPAAKRSIETKFMDTKSAKTKSELAELLKTDVNDAIARPIERSAKGPIAVPLPSLLQNKPKPKLTKVPAQPMQSTRQELHANRRKTSQPTLSLRSALLGEDLENLIAEETTEGVTDTAIVPVSPKFMPRHSQKTVKRGIQPNPFNDATAPAISSIIPPEKIPSGKISPKNSLRKMSVDSASQQAKNEKINEKAIRAFSNTKAPGRLESRTNSNVNTDTNVNTEDVLLSYREPVIVSRVEGPRKILVGREARYRVTLQNTSRQSAKDLNATIRVPNWVDLVDVMSSRGVVQRIPTDENKNVLHWRIHELDPGASQTLRLRLIPRSGRALQLGIRWSQAAVGAETVVEVQEPKLHMTIGGPSQVLAGKSQRYRLSISNPGTGVAEKVVIHLIPPGGKPDAALKHVVGSLSPGEAKEIELELTAQEAGDLVMQATALAEGGIKSEATKQVLCRKPELQIDWRGPEKKYAGTVATYFFRLRNPGTAKTEPLRVKVQLPEQAKFVSASDGHAFETRGSQITWDVIGLSPKEERFLQVRCRIDRAGANRLTVTAQDETGDLTATQSIQTEVIALADLKLSVSDPRGPVAVGEPAEYVIRVYNHGTTGAENVNIAALFSEGIEPTSVEGAQYTVRDGRVTFQPIKSLAAGGEIVLRIRAEASRAGNHIFRTEVFCSDLDIKLSAEETTRFFVDNDRWEEGETPYSAERSETTNR